MKKNSLLSLCLGIMVVTAPRAAALEAWVCSDMYHVNPVDGAILEFGGAVPEGFSESNSVWHAASRTISLVGSRNETVAFQVVLEGEAEGLDVVVSDWQGPTNFPAKAVRRFYVWNKRGDALVPMITPRTRPFSLPFKNDLIAPLKQQVAQPIWIDLAIPGDIQHGDYTAIIAITSGGKTLRSMKLRLEVLDLTLPERPAIPGLLRWRGARYLERWGGFPDYAYRTQNYAIEMIAYRMFWDHRCSPFIEWMDPATGQPYSECAPKVTGEGADMTISRWDFFDRRFQPLLGQTWGLKPPAFFQIPFSATFPVKHSLYKEDPEAYAKAVEDLLGEFVRHCRTSGFSQTHYVFTGGVGAGNKDVGVNLLSPSGGKDAKAVAMYADIVNRVARAEKMELSYQVETKRFCGRGALPDGVGTWLIPAGEFANAKCAEKIAQGAKEGQRFVATMGLPDVEDKATDTVGAIWSLWGRGVSAIAYQYCGGLSNIDGNSVSEFFYEGEQSFRRALIPTIRLKHIRRGLHDLQYMRLASELDGKNAESIRATMQSYRGGAPGKMEQGRLMLARMLAGGDA